MSARPHLRAHHDAIVAYATEGVPAKEIARLIGAVPSGVRKYCAKHGIPLRNVKDVFAKVEARFRRVCDETCTARDLAAQFGVSEVSIRRWAKHIGVELLDAYHCGHILTHNGYKRVPAPSHPLADSKGYVLEHRLVVEAHLGRYLSVDECVHHKDGDKLNNEISNLEVMTLSEHAALHAGNGDTGWAVYHAAGTQQDIV